jgi:MFS family permease
VVLGYTISSLTRPLVALAVAPWNIILIRFVDRIGKGIRTSPRDLLINDSTLPAGRGRAFGFHRAMDHLGAALGTLAAFGLLLWVTHLHHEHSNALPASDFRGIFWAAAIPAALAVATLVVRVREVPPVSKPAAPPTLTLRPFGTAFKGYLAILLLFTLANSSDMFLLWAAGLTGVPVLDYPLLWALLHVVKSAISTPGGTLSDRIGRRTFIVAGWLVYAVVYLGFALAHHPYQIWILFGAYGVFAGLTEGAERALVSELTEPPTRGIAFGVYNFTTGIGYLPANLMMGFLLQKIGQFTAFATEAGIAVAAALALSAWLGTHHGPMPADST